MVALYSSNGGDLFVLSLPCAQKYKKNRLNMDKGSWRLQQGWLRRFWTLVIEPRRQKERTKRSLQQSIWNKTLKEMLKLKSLEDDKTGKLQIFPVKRRGPCNSESSIETRDKTSLRQQSANDMRQSNCWCCCLWRKSSRLGISKK